MGKFTPTDYTNTTYNWWYSVLGWDRLLSEVVNVWTGDVKSQLPKILGGVGPIHYLMQFGKVYWLQPYIDILLVAGKPISWWW